MVVCLVLSFFVWWGVAVVYESILESYRALHGMRTPRPTLCKFFYGGVALICFLSRGILAVPELLGLIPVALSHIDLSRMSSGPIHWKEIVLHIPAATRRVWARRA